MIGEDTKSIMGGKKKKKVKKKLKESEVTGNVSNVSQ